MNFVSHFYCHSGKSPEFDFGLLFPDFLGIISRNYKLHQFEQDYQAPESDFVKGIGHHKLADQIWHNHSFFKTKTTSIKELLQQYGMEEKPYRPFFMTHVMLELLLDRTILKNDLSIGIKMYESLEKVEPIFLSKLFKDGRMGSSFIKFYRSFVENRYALSYVDNEMFTYALNRLFNRVKHPPLNILETDSFVNQLDRIVENDFLKPLHEISNERIE